MAKCPIYDVDLEVDDTYDFHYDTEFNMIFILKQIGHCSKCDRNYQWNECYDLTDESVRRFKRGLIPRLFDFLKNFCYNIYRK